jgi:hypothetical protein
LHDREPNHQKAVIVNQEFGLLNGQIMMIEDDELRSLYRLSSEEQLQKLEAGLLSLEE